MGDPKPPPSKLLKQHRALVASTRGTSGGIMLGSSAAVAVGGLGWLGHRADVRFDTEPWLAVVGVCLGFVYAGVEIWKLVRMSRDADTSSADEQGGEG